MVIYNVTYALADGIHQEWLSWMRETHIREIIETGLYERYQLVKLLDINEEESATYAVQLYAETKAKHLEFMMEHETAFRLKSSRQWGNEVMSFGTLMQIVQ
jgi:predicted nucleic-acid-binding protein